MSQRVSERVTVLLVAAGLPVAAMAQGDPLEQPWASSQSFTSLRGATAWQAIGVQDNGLLGLSVSVVGDVNGDGVGDAIFGAPAVGVDGLVFAGEAYIVFGVDGGLPRFDSVSSLDGSNGFTFRGASAEDSLGRATGSGDFNGDGISDVVIGAPTADSGSSRSGESYVVFGRSDGFPASLGPDDLDGANGFRIPGAVGREFSGTGVAGVGDLNGDGVDDLMIGTANTTGSGATGVAKVYVVFGSRDGFDPVVPLSDIDGSNGFRITTDNPGFILGEFLDSAGDVNGDGLDDAIIGINPIVVFGRTDAFPATLRLSDLDGTNGFAMTGAYGAVSTAGDINGDGIDDIAIGAPYSGDIGDGFRTQGYAYVLFGRSAGFPPLVDLRSLDGSDGFRMDGATNEDQAGDSLAGGGDLNGDGFDDLVVGAPGTGYQYSCYYCGDYNPAEGSAYVFYGRDSGFVAVIQLADVSADSVVRFEGPRDSQMATSLSGMTDFNGDGRSDFLLGAIDGSTTPTRGPGWGMVIYGRGATPCPADLDGDGELTIFDFLAFQIFFDTMDPRADFDGDGDFTIFDFLAFQTAFDVGCP
ncbi:MAG: GC-type dockerin domain-anchored protein [Phycisphaerales bacterium]